MLYSNQIAEQNMAFDINRFTEKSQEALVAAQNLAERNGNSQVEPEHLLLALLEQSEGVVPQVLGKLNVPSARWRSRCAPSSPGCRASAAARSQRSASASGCATCWCAPTTSWPHFGDEYVSTEHLLLALLDHAGGATQRLLQRGRRHARQAAGRAARGARHPARHQRPIPRAPTPRSSSTAAT